MTDTCDKCGQLTDDGQTVRRQTAKQTHWSPAEYDEAFWCEACRYEAEEYERFLEAEGVRQ
jgi:hypothetical protein